jgi:hypothetical protein
VAAARRTRGQRQTGNSWRKADPLGVSRRRSGRSPSDADGRFTDEPRGVSNGASGAVDASATSEARGATRGVTTGDIATSPRSHRVTATCEGFTLPLLQANFSAILTDISLFFIDRFTSAVL